MTGIMPRKLCPDDVDAAERKAQKPHRRAKKKESVPATQHSFDKHVAAAHVFELGLFINTCGAVQPVNPTHVGAEEKGGK